MVKEKDIIIRVTLELKEKIAELAKKESLSVSSYIRQILIKKIQE